MTLSGTEVLLVGQIFRGSLTFNESAGSMGIPMPFCQ